MTALDSVSISSLQDSSTEDFAFHFTDFLFMCMFVVCEGDVPSVSVIVDDRRQGQALTELCRIKHMLLTTEPPL